MTHTAKHTPGPWVAQQRSWGWDIANGSDLICSGPEHASKNAQANACIIAAAPAMYEALREAQELIRSLVAEEMIHSSELQRVGNGQANMWEALAQANGE